MKYRTGSFDAIEALGFRIFSFHGDSVSGTVRFRDLPRLMAHPGVLYVFVGKRPTLDQ